MTGTEREEEGLAQGTEWEEAECSGLSCVRAGPVPQGATGRFPAESDGR